MYEKFCLNLISEKEAKIVIFGALIGRNADKMLKSLRKTSWFFEWFDIDEGKNLVEKAKVVDIGDIKPKKVEEVIKMVLKEGKIPFMISGSHLATYFALNSFEKDVKVVIFDAHFDLKNNYIDEKIIESVYPLKLAKSEIKKLNRATWVRRSFEKTKRNFCFIGTRSVDEFELEFAQSNNILYFTPKLIRRKFKEVEKKLEDFCKNSKVYLSIDIDVFDPSIAPAVCYPEPYGIFWPEFQKLLKKVFCGRIVGLDLVEIEPMKENKITEFLAVKLIFNCLFLLSKF